MPRPPGLINPAAAVAAPSSAYTAAPGQLPAPEVAASPDLSRLPHVWRPDGVDEPASTASGVALPQTAGLRCPARAEPGADISEPVPRPDCGDGPAGADGGCDGSALQAPPPRKLHPHRRPPAAVEAVAEAVAAGSVPEEGQLLQAAAAATAAAPPAPPLLGRGSSSAAEPAAARHGAAASPAGITVSPPQACELRTPSPPAASAAPSTAAAAHASDELAAGRTPPHSPGDSCPAAEERARSDGHRAQHPPHRRGMVAEGGLLSAALPGRPAEASGPRPSWWDRAGGAAVAAAASTALPPQQHPLDACQEQVGMSPRKEVHQQLHSYPSVRLGKPNIDVSHAVAGRMSFQTE